MGRVTWSSEIFNCSPPDAGNMETIERYGTPEQKERRSEGHTSELQSLMRISYAVFCLKKKKKPSKKINTQCRSIHTQTQTHNNTQSTTKMNETKNTLETQ